MPSALGLCQRLPSPGRMYGAGFSKEKWRMRNLCCICRATRVGRAALRARRAHHQRAAVFLRDACRVARRRRAACPQALSCTARRHAARRPQPRCGAGAGAGSKALDKKPNTRRALRQALKRSARCGLKREEAKLLMTVTRQRERTVMHGAPRRCARGRGRRRLRAGGSATAFGAGRAAGRTDWLYEAMRYSSMK